MQTVIISKLLRPLSFLGALIAHVWDPLGALNGPQIPRFTFVHPTMPIPGYGPVMIMMCFLVSCLYTRPVKDHNMTLVST